LRGGYCKDQSAIWHSNCWLLFDKACSTGEDGKEKFRSFFNCQNKKINSAVPGVMWYFDFTIVPFLTYVYVQLRITNSCSNDCIKLEIINVLVSRKEKILCLSFHICRIYGYAWQVGNHNPVQVFIFVTYSFVFIIAFDFARLHKNNACYNIIREPRKN